MVSTIQRRIGEWAAANNTTVARWALGTVFLWFGVLKFCPGLCDVEVLAQRVMGLLTFNKFAPSTCMRVLAIWECSMGLTLLFAPRATRWGMWALQACFVSLLMHLAGTFLPLVLFPSDTWKHVPYAPTLVGQYILKNVVLLAAAVSVGAGAFAQPARLELIPSRAALQRAVRRQA